MFFILFVLKWKFKLLFRTSLDWIFCSLPPDNFVSPNHPDAPDPAVSLDPGPWSLGILPPWETIGRKRYVTKYKNDFKALPSDFHILKKYSKLVSHPFLWKAASKLHIWSLSTDLFNFREGHYENCYYGHKWRLSVHLQLQTTRFSILDWRNLRY